MSTLFWRSIRKLILILQSSFSAIVQDYPDPRIY